MDASIPALRASTIEVTSLSIPSSSPLARVVLLYVKAAIAEGDRLRRGGNKDGAVRSYPAVERVVGSAPKRTSPSSEEQDGAKWKASNDAGSKRMSAAKTYMTLLSKQDKAGTTISALELESLPSAAGGGALGAVRREESGADWAWARTLAFLRTRRRLR